MASLRLVFGNLILPDLQKLRKMNTKLIIASALLLLSCSKKNQVTEVKAVNTATETAPTLNNYSSLDPFAMLDYFFNKADVHLYISSYAGRSPQLTCGFKAGLKPMTSNIAGITLAPFSTNGLRALPAQQNTIASFAGRPQNSVINYSIGGRNYSASLVVPVTENLFLPGQDLSSIYKGKKIIWASSKGGLPYKIMTKVGGYKEFVLISLSYDVNAPGNRVKKAPLQRIKPTYKNILLDDAAGSYVFSDNDVTDFPSGATIGVNIYRGTVSTPEINGENFLVGSYSAVLFETKKK